MVILEARAPVGRAEERLQGASQVDKAVTHEEEHGEQRRQVVYVTKEDTALADAQSQDEGSGRLAAARRYGKRCQQRDGAVLGNGLCDRVSRCGFDPSDFHNSIQLYETGSSKN